jgi:hypothetical protein
MFCTRCGIKSSIEGQKFCAHCGGPLAQTEAMRSVPEVADRKGGGLPIVWKILGVLIVLGFVSSIISGLLHRNDPLPETAEQKKEKIRNNLDPPPTMPLTAKEHLDRGKTLLSQIDINGNLETAETLIQLVSEHGTEARKDPRVKAQAGALMKRMADKAIDVAKMQAWNSTGAILDAQVVCRMGIESRLKAPSTANWSRAESGKWRDHPGYFLVRYSVDAENSFGAKLRNNYECQVVCLTEAACQIAKLYPLE